MRLIPACKVVVEDMEHKVATERHHNCSYSGKVEVRARFFDDGQDDYGRQQWRLLEAQTR